MINLPNGMNLTLNISDGTTGTVCDLCSIIQSQTTNHCPPPNLKVFIFLFIACVILSMILLTLDLMINANTRKKWDQIMNKISEDQKREQKR